MFKMEWKLQKNRMFNFQVSKGQTKNDKNVINPVKSRKTHKSVIKRKHKMVEIHLNIK